MHIFISSKSSIEGNHEILTVVIPGNLNVINGYMVRIDNFFNIFYVTRIKFYSLIGNYF